MAQGSSIVLQVFCLNLIQLCTDLSSSVTLVVTPTDRPKSVCNRCVIELVCGVVCVCPFDISVGVGVFVIGLSQIFSIFSYSRTNKTIGFYDGSCQNL